VGRWEPILYDKIKGKVGDPAAEAAEIQAEGEEGGKAEEKLPVQCCVPNLLGRDRLCQNLAVRYY